MVVCSAEQLASSSSSSNRAVQSFTNQTTSEFVMNYKTDAQIHNDVLQELKWDSNVDETDVGVEVDDGVVTLTGTVTSYAKGIAAQEATHRVLGVLDVANDIQVKTPGRGTPTDTELAQAVRDAMRWNVFVDDARITSTVKKGFVTLEGSTDTLHERDQATAAVRALKGIHGVVNHIRVTPGALNPGDVRTAINAALIRRAENASRAIDVLVANHDVILEGRVPSWIEKQAVVEAAGHVHGIARIIDHINIVPIENSHPVL